MNAQRRSHPAIVDSEAAFVGVLTSSGDVPLVPTLADALERPECVLAAVDLPQSIAQHPVVSLHSEYCGS